MPKVIVLLEIQMNNKATSYIMKKIIFLFFAFLYASTSIAQLLECPVTLDPNYVEPPASVLNSLIQNQNSTDKYVFNVKFHIVKNDDGSGVTATYGENEVMNAIMILNTNFNQFNIFFKYKGYDVINSTSFMKVRAANFPDTNLSHPTFDQLLEYSKTGMTNPVYDYNAMNLFIVEGLDYSTISPFNPMVRGAAKMPGIDSIYGHNHLLSKTLPHEIAHNFKLYHTYQDYGTENCEHVANFGDIFYNSDTHGDRIEDTKASFMFGGAYANPATCTFQNPNGYADCIGTPYVDVPIKNYMSSTNPCQDLHSTYLPGTGEFTSGQGVYMRNIIALYYNHPNNFYGFNNAKNTVESLYQPFETIPYGGNIIRSVTDNNDGTAEVCRNMLIRHRFQKGFDYAFTNLNPSDPSIATLIDLPEIINTTYTFGVQINQVNPDIVNDVFVDCNRGSFCQTEDFVKGLVVSTNVLGSMNLTLEELNEIQVKDPELYDKLMSQYYHIINKETSSGAVKQTFIYKY